MVKAIEDGSIELKYSEKKNMGGEGD